MAADTGSKWGADKSSAAGCATLSRQCGMRRDRVVAAALALTAVLAGAPAAESCPRPPTPVKDLDLPRFYSDIEGSVVDPAAAARHKAAVEPLNAFLRQVVADADKSWRRAKREAQKEAADCALAWLAAWAKGEAWLGNMATRQGEYQRKWDLAGLALAYLKLRRFALPEQRAVIEPWLVRFADAARAFFDDRDRKRNNHWYWLGLAVGATALSAESPRHWEMARSIMQDALRDIAADGSLPHELERKGRALHYHGFAAMPLVAMAELARSRGEDWYAFEGGALHRLVALAVRGYRDPQIFDPLAGAPQERGLKPGAGWLQLYSLRHPGRIAGPLPEAPSAHRWLGGDVLVLVDALGQSR